MDDKERLKMIKQGLRSKNQDEWLTWDDIEWLIEQTEKLEEIRKVFYAEDTNVVDGYRKIIEVFEGKEIPTRKRSN